ncbi:NADPH:quinone reductase-like Zn-dependent oxidoreductase [Actinocorallia herbida]|uniref:NADPH:quinone reductase-like Zn-dependent oxidoreductase n=1 Tax=Actinocorallia herbida TaxID=58109 RepID=A0A3N1D3B7_9ACTN|nr:NADPH:quinone oxidoreductase family protein [Actinocorallia herbida]ROO88025.1 NADPH:quinone reductase-like Zn-dependent oxidoreductase [Actinocorallia herbida]
MRSARVHRHGSPDEVVVEDVAPAPLNGSAQARVRVHAAAVNFPDVLVMAGKYQVSVPVPYTPGCEFAGVVTAAAPDGSGPAVGDAVIGLVTHGAFAEEIVIDSARLTRIPAGLGWHRAAAFGVTYTTAYHALRTVAGVSPGEWVVVLGAAGGVGLAAVDVARAMGARVLAAAGGEDRLELCRAKGAEACVDYRTEDLKTRIRELTGDRAAVVVDPVGGPYSEPALRALTPGGRFVVVGFAAGEIPRIPLNLVLLKGVTIAGVENRTILERMPEVAPAHRAEVLRMLVDGRIDPHVAAVYPLEKVADGLRDVAERRAAGKIIIEMAP